MSVTRERDLPVYQDFPSSWFYESEPQPTGSNRATIATGKQITVSEGHRYDRTLGHYVGGGPFYTSRIDYSYNTVDVSKAWKTSNPKKFYSGPVYADFPTLTERQNLGGSAIPQFGSTNESKLNTDGATAVSLCNPVNPASNLGTTLAEMYREGSPTIPGIQSWQRRTQLAKAAGSEYLNYQFGWAPLVSEVHNVGNAARHSRDLMNQYHHGEGRDTHRRFDFPSQHSFSSLKPVTLGDSARFQGWNTGYISTTSPKPTRTVSRITETKRWFEGCFTYGLPSSTDNWKKAIGFGSQADALFGFALTPDILWELTPWSWAVDWFTNAGDVIKNVSNFALAGLVMRYGYMMEETIDTYTASLDFCNLNARSEKSPFVSIDSNKFKGPLESSLIITTKRRGAANPFGFGISWDGLSPTQIAITAALGITRLL